MFKTLKYHGPSCYTSFENVIRHEKYLASIGATYSVEVGTNRVMLMFPGYGQQAEAIEHLEIPTALPLPAQALCPDGCPA